MDKFYLAAVFGPFMIIVGLVRLGLFSTQRSIVQSFKETPAAVWLSALINLLLGLVIVNVYNVWAWNMALLVTLLGWVLVVRGLLILLWPHCWCSLIQRRMTSVIVSIIAVIWGIALTIFAHY